MRSGEPLQFKVQSRKFKVSPKMQSVYYIQKKLGETPLEALTRLRKDENISNYTPMTYAGRLDPAAEGLLIILTGEECKNKEKYSALSKTYQAEILFGVLTDTHDLLGLCVFPDLIRNPGSLSSNTNLDSMSEHGMTQYLESHLGKQLQKYPRYSSKHLDTGILPPPHEVELISYKNIEMRERSREEILERVEKITGLATGGFRQEEIKKSWQDLPEGKYQTVSVELTVSSGFYIRQFAEDLGKALGTGACLYSLVRTKIDPL